ncbi:hypothetical protein AKJ18_22330 [Vibrio xuii]|nr:hypothetical protein AKJ18_22330 [Vibrio xuii]
MNILVLSEHGLLRDFITKFFQSYAHCDYVKSLSPSQLGFWRALKRYEQSDFSFDHVVLDLDSKYLTAEEQLFIVSRMECKSILSNNCPVTYFASEAVADECSNFISFLNSSLELKPINSNMLRDVAIKMRI